MTTVGKLINATLETYDLTKTDLARRLGLGEHKFYNLSSYLNHHMGYVVIVGLIELFIADPSMDFNLVLDVCRKRANDKDMITNCKHMKEFNRLRKIRINEIPKDMDTADRVMLNSGIASLEDVLSRVFCTTCGSVSACATYTAERGDEGFAAENPCVKVLFEEFALSLQANYNHFADQN